MLAENPGGDRLMSAKDRAAYARRIEALIERTVRAELGEIVNAVETRFQQDEQGDASIFRRGFPDHWSAG